MGLAKQRRRVDTPYVVSISPEHGMRYEGEVDAYQTLMPTSAVASTLVMTSGKVDARLLGVNATLPKALACGLTWTSRMTAPTAGKEGCAKGSQGGKIEAHLRCQSCLAAALRARDDYAAKGPMLSRPKARRSGYTGGAHQ